jgi:H/ACA ribonucleoprotein complex non-core subunit NAF1
LDIDSVLFVDRGKRALGRIFDVFGPVTKPFYAVRFNDSNHIKTFDVQIKDLYTVLLRQNTQAML